MIKRGYDYDVVVIGGGPAGAVAAERAAKRGAKVFLIERSDPEDRPVRCTGLVSPRTLEEAAVGPEVVVRGIRGASIYAPNGHRLWLGGGDGGGEPRPRPRALVIDRRRFDLALLERAAAVGVKVETETTAVGLEAGSVRLRRGREEWTVRARVVIGADGPRSGVARWSGLPGPREIILGLQAIAHYEPEREDEVEVFLGNEVAPGFFAWAVPESPGSARIGLGLGLRLGLGPSEGQNGRRYLDRLLRRLKILTAEVQRFTAGLIPIGPPARTVSDGVLLVGDAAGQAKPTSGGGLYTGIVCAKLAGEVAAKCAERGDTSAAALMEYERRWRRALGRELAFGLRVHRILARLSDPALNRIIAFLDDPEILDLLNEYGDLDYPSGVVKELLNSPHLWHRLLRVVPQAAGLIKADRA